MCGTNDQIPVRGVPCALGRYLPQRSAGGEPRVLTRHACEAGFLEWVECRRQLSPDLEVDELIMCPMLWCRELFNSISATVDHVKTCPRLQDGWYWCPFCRRPERFLECDGSCEVNRQTLLRRKGSVSSRAAGFFNCLGRRDAATEVFKDQANSETERPMCGEFEAYAREAGLDDQFSALELAGVHGMHGRSVCEFEEFPGVSFAGAFGDDTNAMPEICNWLIPEPSIELPGSRMTFTSQPKFDSGPVLAAPELHQSFDSADPDSGLRAASKPVSRANFPVGVTDSGKEDNATSSHWMGSSVSAPVSAVSPHKNVMARWRLNNPPESPVIPNPPQLRRDNKPSIALTTLSTVSSSSNLGSSDAFSLSSAEQWSSDWMDTDDNIINDDLSHASCGGLLDCNLGSTRTQVDEYRDLVKVVNHEWMQRLVLVPDLRDRCAAFSSRELFAEGLEMLQKCLHDNTPRKFVEVFALVHLAFAAAYILHRDDGSYCWSTLFHDALVWRLSLSDQDDQAAFLAVVDLWWQSELSLNTSPIANVGSAFGYLETQQDVIDRFSIRGMDILRKGEIIGNCVEFLNGYREVAIIERNSQCLSGALVSNAQNRAPIVEHMIKTITQPLRKQRGIEAFCDQVYNIEMQLRNGLLQNPRDVEVSLLRSGKRMSKSRLIYEKYCDVVTTLCDRAIKPSNPTPTGETSWFYDDSWHNWRNGFYVDELQEILAVSHELDRCQGISSSANDWSSASVLAVIRPNATPSISPTSPTSSTNFTSTDSSQTSLTNTPISPFSPSFPIINSETTHCSSCPATFRGTPQHRRSNYTRHVRTSRRHSAHAAIKCTHCKSTLMRTDNLAKHLKNKHNISTPSDRQDPIKRSRRVARVTRTDFDASVQLLR